MKKIALTLEQQQVLGLGESLELCDQTGKVLGHFYPVIDFSQWRVWEPPYEEEELQRLEQSPGRRYTTAEILKNLSKSP